jgi:hypothetical protein
MKRSGMLASGKIYEKATFAWRIYREANSWDEKLVAACIAHFVMTHSLVKLMFYLLIAVVTVTIGGVFNNSIWQFLSDLVRDVIKPLIPPQHASRVQRPWMELRVVRDALKSGHQDRGVGLRAGVLCMRPPRELPH